MKATTKIYTIDFYELDMSNRDSINKFIQWVESFGDRFWKYFIIRQLGGDLNQITIYKDTGYRKDLKNNDIIIRDGGEYFSFDKEYFNKNYDITPE